jgi:PAS domain S-box-containing protein
MPAERAAPGFDDGAVFRSLFLANPDALLLVDLQGVIRLANPAALELLGYAEEDLVGLSVDDLAPRGPTMHTSSPIGARPD